MLYAGWCVAYSRWVFNNSNSASNCASNCANNCGNNAQNNAALRGGLFGSVGSWWKGKLLYRGKKVSLACKDKVRNTFQICGKKRTCLFRCLSHQGGVTFQRHNKTLCCVQTKNAGDIWTGNLVGIVVTVRGIRFQNKKWGILLWFWRIFQK